MEDLPTRSRRSFDLRYGPVQNFNELRWRRPSKRRRESLPTFRRPYLKSMVPDLIQEYTADYQGDKYTNSNDDARNFLRGPGGRVAAFAPQSAPPVFIIPDEDASDVQDTTRDVATLAPRGRRRRTSVALRSFRYWRCWPVWITTMRARFGIPRNLTATLRARDKRYY